MSLAVRLALALVLCAVGTTALLGFRTRTSARELLEQNFRVRIEAATVEVKEALESEALSLRELTEPLCKSGTFLDKALVDMERAGGDPQALETGSQIALRNHVPSEAAARRLDELLLVTPQGEILSASDSRRSGTKDSRVAELLKKAEPVRSRLRPTEVGEPSIEVVCTRSLREITLGLVASQAVAPILERVGRAHGAELAVLEEGKPAPMSDEAHEVRVVQLSEVAGLRVSARMSRAPLEQALAELDRQILESGLIAAGLALLLAWVLGRGLSRPIRELARETREVLSGEPRQVRARGGSEIAELAQSFNTTVEELARMKKRLAVSERIAARREIARQVAHEIKNPLAPIRAAVETLRRLRAREDERFDDYFDEATKTVLEEVHRIANIVSEFTRFSRLPAPKPEPVDLIALIKGVVALHGADPELVRTGNVGSATAKVELDHETIPKIRVDRDQLVQVLTNLVQNGLEAAQAVREDPRVVVQVRALAGDRVRIVVRDNGPGVSDEMRERLFEPYATSKATGTGLGLAICQRIIFEHGGELTYRAATKGGAVFEIVLPIAGPGLLDRPLESTSNPVSRHVTREDAGDD